MKIRSFLLSLFLTTSLAVAADVAKVTPADAAKRVADGKAVLVDVREAAEWKDFLAKNGDKEIIVYCRSGRRSETVAGALAAKGLKVSNVGGFKDWTDAGLPVRKSEK